MMLPPQTIQILLISAHPLWLQACSQMLEGLPSKVEVVPVLAATQALSTELTRVLYARSDLTIAVVSLDLPSASLDVVRTLRAAGYGGVVMVLCSRYALPSLQELEENRVEGVVSSMATLEELSTAIYSVIGGHAPPILQQYLHTARTLNRQHSESVLNDRDRAILHLVAADLNDHEIAERLDIGVRTVNNNLHNIYSKLGVKGRAGAVAIAITRGMI